MFAWERGVRWGMLQINNSILVGATSIYIASNI